MADYQGKNVVIIGLGLTGLSCVDFFLARGVTPRVMDTRMTPPGLDKLPEAVERHTGSLNDEWLMAADLIVASPGIALAHPSLSAAADAGIEIVGDIELFCREAQAPIVAIIRVRSPSGRSGCRAKRYSAVTKPRTLSPKNSSRSLLPSPWERCSFA